jgi:replication factor C subunit 3/5
MLGYTIEWSFRISSRRLLRLNKSIWTLNRSSKVRLLEYNFLSHRRYWSRISSFNLSYAVVIINEADALSRDAQAALRRTMEKYSTNIRIIMCANSTSKIISPIRSRCLLVRVAAPEEDEVGQLDDSIRLKRRVFIVFPSLVGGWQMMKVLKHVAKKERISLPEETALSIMQEANGNMRKALLVFEALRMQR